MVMTISHVVGDDQGGDEDGGNDVDYVDLDEHSENMDTDKKPDNKAKFRTPNVKQPINCGPNTVIFDQPKEGLQTFLTPDCIAHLYDSMKVDSDKIVSKP
jgi:hypothetical protein